MFVYSLSGRTKDWLNALPSGTKATLDDLKKEFLRRFFLTTKYLEKRKEIVGFQQEGGINLYDAWERYKLLLKCCPRNKFSKMEITLTFTDGQKTTTCMLLDASTGGTMKNKFAAKIRELIDNMSLNEYRPQSENRDVVKKQGVLSLET